MFCCQLPTVLWIRANNPACCKHTWVKISVSLTQGTSPWIFQNNIFIHNSFFFSFTSPHPPLTTNLASCCETTTACVYYTTYIDVSLIISYFCCWALVFPSHDNVLFILYLLPWSNIWKELLSWLHVDTPWITC